MNKKKWKAGQGIQKGVYFEKLAEEFGEVAREMTMRTEIFSKRRDQEKLKKRLTTNNANLCEELEHLEFIAREFRKEFARQHEEVPAPKKAKAKTANIKPKKSGGKKHGGSLTRKKKAKTV